MGQPTQGRSVLRTTGGLVALATGGTTLVVLSGLASLGPVTQGRPGPGNPAAHSGYYALAAGGGVGSPPARARATRAVRGPATRSAHRSLAATLDVLHVTPAPAPGRRPGSEPTAVRVPPRRPTPAPSTPAPKPSPSPSPSPRHHAPQVGFRLPPPITSPGGGLGGHGRAGKHSGQHQRGGHFGHRPGHHAHPAGHRAHRRDHAHPAARHGHRDRRHQLARPVARSTRCPRPVRPAPWQVAVARRPAA